MFEKQRSRIFLSLASVVGALILISSITGSALATASVQNRNLETQVNFLNFVPCANGGAGEIVQVNGTGHSVFHLVDNGDGQFHVKSSTDYQGVTGIGLTTGDKYQVTGVIDSTFTVAKGFTETFVNNFRVIGAGSGNNVMLHENEHLTFNADGTITATHDNFSVTCG